MLPDVVLLPASLNDVMRKGTKMYRMYCNCVFSFYLTYFKLDILNFVHKHKVYEQYVINIANE